MTISHIPSPAGPTTLRVTVDVEPPHLNVRLEGELDLACADLVEAVTQVEMADVHSVTVDLSGLEFTDLAGLRALLQFRDQQLDNSREIRFVEPQRVVRRVFELAGVGHCLAA